MWGVAQNLSELSSRTLSSNVARTSWNNVINNVKAAKNFSRRHFHSREREEERATINGILSSRCFPLRWMIILVRNMAKFLRFLAWMKIWEIFYFGLTGRRARPPHSLAHTIKPFAWSMNENFLICFLFSHSLCLLFSLSPFDSCQSDWDCSSSSGGSRTKDVNVESVDCRFGSTTLDDDVDCNFNHTFIEFQSHDGSFISAGEETKAKDVVANASWTTAVSGECVDSSYSSIIESSHRRSKNLIWILKLKSERTQRVHGSSIYVCTHIFRFKIQ